MTSVRPPRAPAHLRDAVPQDIRDALDRLTTFNDAIEQAFADGEGGDAETYNTPRRGQRRRQARRIL